MLDKTKWWFFHVPTSRSWRWFWVTTEATGINARVNPQNDVLTIGANIWQNFSKWTEPTRTHKKKHAGQWCYFSLAVMGDHGFQWLAVIFGGWTLHLISTGSWNSHLAIRRRMSFLGAAGCGQRAYRYRMVIQLASMAGIQLEASETCWRINEQTSKFAHIMEFYRHF